MANFAIAQPVASATITGQPSWTTVLALPTYTNSWSYVRIYNLSDKRLDVSFDGTNEHDWVESGAVKWWDFPDGARQAGDVRVRGDGADPTAGTIVYVSGRAT